MYEKGEVLVRPPAGAKAADSTPETGSFTVQPASQALAQDPARHRQSWMKRVELLQVLLQRVERYRRSAS
jgi:hypothetical protein